MKHSSSSTDLQSRGATHAEGVDADFGCFLAMLANALCAAVSTRDDDDGGAWFSLPWERDASVSYQGQATAVGEDTYASAKLTMNMTDFRFLSITTGSSELQALARAAPGETAYTDAYDAFVPSGADILIQTTTISQGTWSDETGEWSASTSTTSFFTIDFTWFDLPKAWTFMAVAYDDGVRATTAPGNIAFASADVSANGADTLTDFSADVLTVENTISTASLIGFAGVFG